MLVDFKYKQGDKVVVKHESQYYESEIDAMIYSDGKRFYTIKQNTVKTRLGNIWFEEGQIKRRRM